MLLQHGAHGPVALSGRMHVLDRNGKRHRVVDHIGDIEVVVALGYDEHVVTLVVIVISIFHRHVISGVHRHDKAVKTTVAYESDTAGDVECHVIGLVLVHYIEAHGEVGVMNVATLHVDKKLFAEVKLIMMSPHGQAFEAEFEFSELSHS